MSRLWLYPTKNFVSRTAYALCTLIKIHSQTLFLNFVLLGDSAGGQLAAALSIRWRSEVLRKQREETARGGDTSAEDPLPPIRAQLLIYPHVHLVNLTTTSNQVNRKAMSRYKNMCRFVPLLTCPDRQHDSSLLDAICVSNYTTRATRERLARYFHFGPVDGSEDEVSSKYTVEYLQCIDTSIEVSR